ncbi:MAG: hypothetical protein ACOCQG_06265 [Candidatus Nanoarchaeia archaeon]
MAKPKKSAKETLKWKKKKWVKVLAPKAFNNTSIGESLVMNPENLVGRTVESNLMTLTGDMKKQNINVKFNIDKIQDAQAYTSVRRYVLVPSAVKRMIRRTRDRVDHSFITKSKDGLHIRLKPILITNTNTSNAVLTLLRKKAESLLKKYLEKTNFEDFFSEVLSHKIQNELKNQLKDIYPLKICELRAIEVLKTTKKGA